MGEALAAKDAKSFSLPYVRSSSFSLPYEKLVIIQYRPSITTYCATFATYGIAQVLILREFRRMCNKRPIRLFEVRQFTFAAFTALGLLACLSLSANDRLGASLRLEGRMALRRGLQTLLAWQGDDGSWADGDAAATGQAVMAIMMSGLASEWAELQTAQQRGNAWLEAWLRIDSKQDAAGWAHSALVAIRPLLRQSGPGSRDWSKLVETALKHISLDRMEESDAPWILEAAALNDLPYAEALHRPGAGSPACRLATAWLTGRPESEQALLRAAVWESNWEQETPAGWYWLARSGRICKNFAPGGQGSWKERLMAIMLSRQRGDGGWGEAEDKPAKRVLDSALALQTMILCLA
jgi:hypothetical protein